MNVQVEIVDKTGTEQVLIRCYALTREVTEIADFVRAKSASLLGYSSDKVYSVNLDDIYYVEAVDSRLFAYVEKEVYEIKSKLYEFEALYKSRRFFRCSKSAIINLMKIDCIKPAHNGRFTAKLKNGEAVIISRQYVPELKDILTSGR